MLLKTVTAFTVAHSITLGRRDARIRERAGAAAQRRHRAQHPVPRSRDRPLVAGRDEPDDPPALGRRLRLRAPARVRIRERVDHGRACLARRFRSRSSVFNLGVEVGQLAVRRCWSCSSSVAFRVLEIRWPRGVEALPGYAVGSLGAFWTIQRTWRAVRGRAVRERPVRASAPELWLAAALCGRRGARPCAAGGEAIGFAGGLRHPISGLDHVLAMVAVGLWGAQLGRAGDLAAAGDVPDGDGVRRDAGLAGRAASGHRVRHRGCRRSRSDPPVMIEARPPLGVAAALVGFFAIFHGHAHGTELPAGANGLLYSIGFVTGDRRACTRSGSPSASCTAGARAGSRCASRARSSR